MSAQPEHALRVGNRCKNVSEPRLVGKSGVAVCPGDIEDTVMEPERGVQSHAEVVPCGGSVVTAKRPARAWQVGAARKALFVTAVMIDMQVGCPRLGPRIWKAKIA